MKLQRNRIVGIVALVAVGALALSGCGRPATPDGEASNGDIPTTAGFDGETISLGYLTVTSGPLTPVAAPVVAAANAWEQWVNANGGIGGFQVELNITDSGYNPAQAIQQYEASKDDVVMFASIFGTPIVASVLPQLQADGIFAVGATGDGSLFRERELAMQFTPIESQVLTGIDYALREGDKGEDAVFCGAALEGPLTESLGRALDYAEQEMDVTLGTTVSVAQGVTDATPQVLQLQSGNCDVVIVQGVAGGTTALTSSASKLGYAPLWVSTVTGYQAVADTDPLYNYLRENLVSVADVLPFGDDSAEGMADLVAAHEAYAADTTPDTGYVVGWVAMLMVQSILEEAIERGDLSHEGIVDAAAALSTFDLRGIGPVWTWGEPEDRKAPSTYTVYRPDGSNPAGVSAIEKNVDAPEAAVNYPY